MTRLARRSLVAVDGDDLRHEAPVMGAPADGAVVSVEGPDDPGAPPGAGQPDQVLGVRVHRPSEMRRILAVGGRLTDGWIVSGARS